MLRSQSVFFGNYFCLIPRSDLAFVAVSKNAVTFLKKVALHAASGHWPVADFEVHASIGYRDTSPFLVAVPDMRAFEAKHGPRRKFAVWRDPIARVESTYALFCLGREHRDNFSMFDLQRDPSVERFRAFCEWEWSKPDPLTHDEHLRAQADYYARHEVDDVVDLRALHGYLTRFGVEFRAERSNATSSGFRLADHPDFLARVREIYARDYEIEVNVR